MSIDITQLERHRAALMGHCYRMMPDPRLKPEVNPMPFDGTQMIFGGFEMIVEA